MDKKSERLIKGLRRIVAETSAWFKPNKEALLVEFEEEPSLSGYAESVTGVSDPKKLKGEFLKIMDQAETKTLTGDEIFSIKDIPAGKGSTLEDVGRIVKNYAGPKDWENIVSRIKNKELMPMPVVRKKKNGELRALGGRTRLSAAALLGLPVDVLVLEDAEIKPMFFDTKLDQLGAVFNLMPEYKEYGIAYVKYLLNRGEKPKFISEDKESGKDIHKWAEDVAKDLESYV